MPVEGVKSFPVLGFYKNFSKISGEGEKAQESRISRELRVTGRGPSIKEENPAILQDQLKTSTRNMKSLGTRMAEETWSKDPNPAALRKARERQASPIRLDARKAKDRGAPIDMRPESAGGKKNGPQGAPFGNSQTSQGRGPGQINTLA